MWDSILRSHDPSRRVVNMVLAASEGKASACPSMTAARVFADTLWAAIEHERASMSVSGSFGAILLVEVVWAALFFPDTDPRLSHAKAAISPLLEEFGAPVSRNRDSQGFCLSEGGFLYFHPTSITTRKLLDVMMYIEAAEVVARMMMLRKERANRSTLCTELARLLPTWPASQGRRPLRAIASIIPAFVFEEQEFSSMYSVGTPVDNALKHMPTVQVPVRAPVDFADALDRHATMSGQERSQESVAPTLAAAKPAKDPGLEID